MINRIKILSVLFLLVLGLSSGTIALADIADDTGLSETGQAAGLSDIDVYTYIGVSINAFLGILGIIFLIIALYAGFLWMTAGGDSDKVTKSRQWLINSIIGLIILLSAYALSNFVIQRIVESTIGQ